jgi:very-short-patch-repair endonuclease
MDLDQLVRFVAARSGVARRADLVRAGFGASMIRRAHEAGVLQRFAHGCYGLPGVSPDAVAAVRVAGATTCVSALRALRLPLVAAPAEPHVVVPTGRGAPRRGLLPAGTVLHWGIVPADRVPDAAQSLAHATRCLPLRELVAPLDAALARGVVDEASLAGARRWSRRREFDAAIRLADARSGSIQETFVRVALVQAGLDVVPQVAIPGVGRVDLLVEGRVVVETDGFAYHGDRRAFREDRRRDRELELRGYPVLRYTYEDAVFATGRVVEQVARLVDLTSPLVRQPAR